MYNRFAPALLTALIAVQGLATEVDSQIRQLLDRQAADWNRGDLEAFMRGYENSPATTFVGKTVERGYDQVLARYRKVYPNAAAMGSLTFSEIAVRMLDPQTAIVNGRFRLARAAEAGGNASGIFTLVVRRTAGGWKIVHDHTSS